MPTPRYVAIVFLECKFQQQIMLLDCITWGPLLDFAEPRLALPMVSQQVAALQHQ